MTRKSIADPTPAAQRGPTHDEQEATILHLRSRVTLLEAKLAAKRRKQRAKPLLKQMARKQSAYNRALKASVLRTRKALVKRAAQIAAG